MIAVVARVFRFSPVAGIQWVETSSAIRATCRGTMSFSPVAGIQWVETTEVHAPALRSGGVSVPLPGFSGLRRHTLQIEKFHRHVSVPLPGFSGLRRLFTSTR